MIRDMSNDAEFIAFLHSARDRSLAHQRSMRWHSRILAAMCLISIFVAALCADMSVLRGFSWPDPFVVAVNVWNACNTLHSWRRNRRYLANNSRWTWHLLGLVEAVQSRNRSLYDHHLEQAEANFSQLDSLMERP